MGIFRKGVLFALSVTFSFDSGRRRPNDVVWQYESNRWVRLAREVGAHRLLLDGSFVTARAIPNDVGAVMLLPSDFRELLSSQHPSAVELEDMLITRQPEELFAAEDAADWDSWVAFFSQTRESDGRRKGLIEVEL